MNPPPIQWLPAFEASARLLSFKKAALQLNVTPPAVSQQIKTLEEYLGKKLFDRTERQLQLTEAGHFYYQVATEVMKAHKQGFQEFDRRFNNRILQVSTPLYIAQELLIPNYMGFKDYAASTELRISTGTDYIDFNDHTADAAIRFGSGQWDDLDCRLLSAVELSPVCSPDYLTNSGLDLAQPWTLEMLADQVLIAMSDSLADWSNLSPELPGQLPFRDKIICDSYFSAIKSAEQGLGVALGVFPAINRLVNEGSLVIPMEKTFKIEAGYWLVAPKNRRNNEVLNSFYLWSKELFNSLPELKNHAEISGHNIL